MWRGGLNQSEFSWARRPNGLHKFSRTRISACGETVWINQNVLELADRMAYISSVAQGYQHVARRFESIRMFLSLQTEWPTLVESHKDINMWRGGLNQSEYSWGNRPDGLHKFSRTRISTCGGEVWINQNILEVADRMSYISSVAQGYQHVAGRLELIRMFLN